MRPPPHEGFSLVRFICWALRAFSCPRAHYLLFCRAHRARRCFRASRVGLRRGQPSLVSPPRLHASSVSVRAARIGATPDGPCGGTFEGVSRRRFPSCLPFLFRAAHCPDCAFAGGVPSGASAIAIQMFRCFSLVASSRVRLNLRGSSLHAVELVFDAPALRIVTFATPAFLQFASVTCAHLLLISSEH